MTRKEKILGFMSQKEYKPMNLKEIMALLCVPKNDRAELEEIIHTLENEGKIYKNHYNKYILLENSGFLTGTFFATDKGFGFINDSQGERYFVSPHDVSGAINKDKVLFKITRKCDSSDKCSEAKIIKILSHSTDGIVGTFFKQRNFGFVIPDNKVYANDIYISKKHSDAAQDGQKVVCKITVFPKNNENPEGIIEEVLGFPEDKNVDIKSVIREFGICEDFSQKAELSALSFGDRVYEEELEGREDFRENLIFTIDGDDSKDFDDAVEIAKTENGYRLGVHIADVSYYVSENSALDIDARKRGTSVYFPNYVVPMLPQKLSNGICSLNPGCDRLTLSVIMEFDSDANLLSHQICEGVICSKERMTYNNVSKILDGDKDLCKKYEHLVPTLETMHELSVKLKSKRMSKGSIDFDFPEIKVILDENGKAVDVYKYQNTKAHSLIEEFMLATNVCVAEEMFWCEIPFIYRIHEKPSPEKIVAFSKFISFLGLRLKGSTDSPHPGSFAEILEKIKGSDNELMVSKVMLRSLMKAKYSEENMGHFGLSFSHYCHFTSPIRRYPDLAIHRIIKEHIKFGITPNRMRFLEGFVKKASKSSSEAELRAMEAERFCDNMKKAEFMSDKIGEKYDATVTSVTHFGMFAQTPFGIEGLISMSDLKDDYYEYDERKLMLVGIHTGKTYSIGDKITINVKRADKRCGEIDFLTESSDENE